MGLLTLKSPARMKTVYIVVGLTGATEATFATRQYAQELASQWNRELDAETQDRQDRDFCARHGVPFMPRRYFVMQETVAS